jgi:hypothetical protein
MRSERRVSSGPTDAMVRATEFLLAAGDPAIAYLARRDLQGERVEHKTQVLWTLLQPVKLLRGQQPDGGWKAPTGGYPQDHKRIFETYKRLRMLVERYEFDRSHPGIELAATYLFSTQSVEGDFRGMTGDQYATYYTGEFAALLIKAGFDSDPRIDQALQWLLGMRQQDGGWSIPTLTRGLNMREISGLLRGPSLPLLPDRSKPFSHNWTDMVLRAFAAHPRGRRLPEARRAAQLLKQSFFEPDLYFSMQDAAYWLRFVHWWPNLLTALESLCAMGYSGSDPDVARGVDWFRRHQQRNGSWRTSYFPGSCINPRIERIESLWVTLRIARVLLRAQRPVHRNPQTRIAKG